jgi:hypothetical protein
MILQSIPKVIYRLTNLRPLEPPTHIKGIIQEAFTIDVSIYVSALLDEFHFLLLLYHLCEQCLPRQVAFPEGVTEVGDGRGEFCVSCLSDKVEARVETVVGKYSFYK